MVQQTVDEILIQLCIAIQRDHDVSVDHAQKRGGIGALAAAHVAVVFYGVREQLFDQFLLPGAEGLHGLEGFAFARGEPHGKVEAVEARVAACEVKESAGHCVQGGMDVSSVAGGFLQAVHERVEVLCQQRFQQAALAAEVVVHGRLADPGRVADGLHTHGVVAVQGEQVQGTFEQILTIIHCALVYRTVHKLSRGN